MFVASLLQLANVFMQPPAVQENCEARNERGLNAPTFTRPTLKLLGSVL